VTSSVTQIAGVPTGGTSAAPKTLVELVKMNERTPASTDSSNKFSVPVMFVSMKFCRVWVMTWGLCREAVCKTVSTPVMQRFTNSRSTMDPTSSVKSDLATSTPIISCFVFRNVRTSASPKCPLLPVIKIFMQLSFRTLVSFLPDGVYISIRSTEVISITKSK
jgi:hypothetical protein